MGTTPKLGLPWPAGTADARDGFTAIRQLAEAVEDELLAPLLVTDGTGVTSWTDKVAEVGWDVTDDPARKRGPWDSTGAADQLVIPGAPGYYVVSTTVRFGGKAEPDWYDAQIRTRQQGEAKGAGTKWAGTRVEMPANAAGYTELNLSTVVRIADATPRDGITVRLAYGGANNPPNVAEGVQKLRIHWLGAL